jgi:hypothetical protein
MGVVLLLLLRVRVIEGLRTLSEIGARQQLINGAISDVLWGVVHDIREYARTHDGRLPPRSFLEQLRLRRAGGPLSWRHCSWDQSEWDGVLLYVTGSQHSENGREFHVGVIVRQSDLAARYIRLYRLPGDPVFSPHRDISTIYIGSVDGAGSYFDGLGE